VSAGILRYRNLLVCPQHITLSGKKWNSHPLRKKRPTVKTDVSYG